MAINFPTPPIYTDPTMGGRVYNSTRGVWEKPRGADTALPLNYIVNPCFQHSQQNLDVVGTASAYFMADQWSIRFVSATGTYQASRVAWATNNKSKYRLRIYVASANTAPAVGDYLAFAQQMEGLRVLDFGWSASTGKQMLVRFGFYSSINGTFTMCIRNGVSNRSYLAPFTVVAGAHSIYSFVVPNDPLGSSLWPIDNTIGMQFWITLAASTTYGSGVAGWQAGNHLAIAGTTKAYSTGAAIFELFDVGMYLDPYRTGKLPYWEAPDDQMELLVCQRYWYRAYVLKGFVSSATGATRMAMAHPVPMRIAPAAAIVGACRAYDQGAAPAMSSVSANVSTIDVCEMNITTVTGLTAGRACEMPQDGVDVYIAMSARP